MNHFMARLIFCFFAEDTDIFNGERPVHRHRRADERPRRLNTHEVIGELFRAMNTPTSTSGADAARRRRPGWADVFPYVNGGLFSGSVGRAALQPDRALLPAARRRPRLEADQPGHLRLDDPGRRRRRGARRARHALHQRAEHPEGAEPAVPRRPARASSRRRATTPASC